MENQSEFVEFLIEAKKATYAGGGAFSAPSRPCSRDLAYQRGRYAYMDTYLGDIDFIGEEAVWRDGAPVWSMNYAGQMLSDEVPEEFGHFLKEALLRVPAEAPYRGPALYREGALEFTCSWKGDLEWFEGAEQISADGRPIYRLMFHGGRIRQR
jgi:hypothetical protein